MLTNVDIIPFYKPIQHNADCMVCFNPKDQIIAYAVQNEIITKKWKTEENQKRYICDFTVDFISFSPDSELICCCMFKQNLIQFKITVWSLVSSECVVIENPKFVKSCYSFSKCSKYMAVIERRDFVDSVGIYACDGWQLLKSFSVDLENASEIHFSPNDLVVAVVGAVSDEYKVMFYTIDGQQVNTWCKLDAILGITSFSWSGKSNYVFVGDYLDKITILNGLRYNEVCSLNLPESLDSDKTNIYHLTESKYNEEISFKDHTEKWEYHQVECERPVSISELFAHKKVKHKNPRNGISMIMVSADEQYAAIVSYSMPNVVFVLCTITFTFSDVIIQNENIKGMSWHPSNPILSLFTTSNNLDFWTSDCCIHVVSPFHDKLLIKKVEWCGSGEFVLLNGKLCSTFLTLPS